MHPTVAAIAERYPSGFLIPEEAASELRLHYQTILSHIKARRLIAGNYAMGRRPQYRITLHALSDFVKGCERGETGDAASDDVAWHEAPATRRKAGSRRAPMDLVSA
ncbi:MAG: hypothetical protein U0R70_17525 [Solirubrobacteraceae bacterium]